ncbi:restriction endonuclease subunit S [Neisseria sicca]|uniref:restriction endonuclease subunit S n=1 Tax=Neisseria sicca TaxID=490 RepID=UPI003F9F8D1D
MEGLEVEEIQFQNVLNNPNLRLEAEFFIKKTNLFESSIGAEIIDFVQYGTSEELNEDKRGYPILRLNEFDGSFLGIPAKYSEKISLDTYRSLEIKKGDVLICRTNGNLKYVGKAAIAMQDYSFAFASYLFRIRPNKFINPETLTVFLNSKSGRREIEKYAMKGNQSNFSPAKFREIKIPHFSTVLQDEIKALVSSSFEKLQKSKEAYQTAQNLLLEHLDLKDFNPPTQTVNIKSFADSFGTSGRLDAEFYQEKYESYLKKIQAYPNGCELIRTACKLKDANYTPKDNQTYRYIELSNIGNSGEITGASLDLGCNLPSRARRKVSKNDVIVSSIEGSLASCAIVSEQYHQALCSTGFYVVSSEKINSETLLMLFKSGPIQQLLKQGCSGTILTAINKDEFLNIPLPLVDANIQTQIADLIRQSDRLRQESQALLEEAKRKVEQAIEG